MGRHTPFGSDHEWILLPHRLALTNPLSRHQPLALLLVKVPHFDFTGPLAHVERLHDARGGVDLEGRDGSRISPGCNDEPGALQHLARAFFADGPFWVCGEEDGVDLGDA